jgi:hypothetical protein
MSAGGEANHLPGVMRAIIGVPIVDVRHDEGARNMTIAAAERGLSASFSPRSWRCHRG